MFSCFPVVDWARHIWNALLCPLLFVGMERSIKYYWQVKRRAQDKEHSPAAQESKAQESATSGALGGGQVVVVGVPALQPATIVDCLLLQPQLRIQKLMCTVPTALPQRDRGEGSPQLSLPTLDHFCPPYLIVRMSFISISIPIYIYVYIYICIYFCIHICIYTLAIDIMENKKKEQNPSEVLWGLHQERCYLLGKSFKLWNLLPTSSFLELKQHMFL